jgi:hypothetical protein
MTGLDVEGFDIQVLRERSISVSPPYHLNFVSCKGFETLLRHAGFDGVELSTPGVLGVDIVYNSFLADANFASANRFAHSLLSRGESERVPSRHFSNKPG